MRTIYKYKLSLSKSQTIETHTNSKILSIQLQNGEPYAWVQVNPSAPKSEITIRMIFTGEDIEDHTRYEYIDTIQYKGYVCHFFKES